MSQLIFANLCSWHIEKVGCNQSWNKNATGSIFNRHMIIQSFRKETIVFCVTKCLINSLVAAKHDYL